MSNFSYLAGLEVPEKFVVVVEWVVWWWGSGVGWWVGVLGHLATMSNLNATCLELL